MTSYLADPAGSDGLQDAAFDDQNSDAGPAATNAVDASDIAVVGDLVEVLAAVTWVVSRVDETVVLESVRGRILAMLASPSGYPLATLALWAGASPSVVSRLARRLHAQTHQRLGVRRCQSAGIWSGSPRRQAWRSTSRWAWWE